MTRARDRTFAVVGCGSIGMRHLRNLASLGCSHLVAIDVDDARREAASTLPGVIGASPSLTDAIDAGADVVVIATPTSLHLSLVRCAIVAGADVFVEKPLSISADGVEDVVREAERRGAVALVASNWRFHPAFVALRSALADGRAGPLFAARATFGSFLPTWHPDEDYRLGYSARRDLGGGILLDAHEVDYLMWFLGSVISASGSLIHTGLLEIETEDLVLAHLAFESGVVGELRVDYLKRPYDRTLTFDGGSGSIGWDVRTGRVEFANAERTDVLHRTDDDYDLNEMYLEQMNHFLDCLDGTAKPTASLRHALEVLRVIDAIRRSSTSGRVEPVR